VLVQQNMPSVRGWHPRCPMRDLRIAAVLMCGFLLLTTAVAFIDDVHWTALTRTETVPAMVGPAAVIPQFPPVHVSSFGLGATAAKRMFTPSSRPEDEARRVTRMASSLGATGAAALPRAGVAGVTIARAQSRAPPTLHSPAPAVCARPFGTLAIAGIAQRPQPVDGGTGRCTSSCSGSCCVHAAAGWPRGLPRRSVQPLASRRLPDGRRDGDTEPEPAAESHHDKDGGNSRGGDSRSPGLLAGPSIRWAPTRATPAAAAEALQPLAPISLACSDVRRGLTCLLMKSPGLGDTAALNAEEVCSRSRPGGDRVGLCVGQRALSHLASPAGGRQMAYLQVGLLSRCSVRWWVDEGRGQLHANVLRLCTAFPAG
jgi:hypothetical protein